MKSSTKILKTFWKISPFLAVTQAFEAGDFLNIFLRFWGVFKAHFLIKIFVVKTKRVWFFGHGE